MVRVLLALGLMVASCLAAEGKPDEPYPVHFHLSPRTPVVRSLKELSFEFYQTYNNTGTLVVHTAEWELRDDYRHRRVARIPIQEYFYEGVKDERSPHPEGSRNDFSADDLRHIGPLEPGNYRMALLIDGKRASNVMGFQIDPNYDPAKAPVLTVGMEEAPPGVNIGSLLVWVVGPNPFDKQFTNFTVAFADITVDGAVRKSEAELWTGPVGPYSIGDADVRPYDTPYRLKGVDVSKPHDFSVQVGQYQSAIVRLNLGSHDLAREWDSATDILAPIPVAKPVLTGTVTGPDGRPALGWDVSLTGKSGEEAHEKLDAKGQYSFSGIAPDDYTLECSSDDGLPIFDSEHFKIEAGRSRSYNITFEGKYVFSGRVMDAKGRPAPGVDIGAEWKNPATGAKIYTDTTTDKDGSYQLGSPFSVIAWVGDSSASAPKPRPVYDAKPGQTNVNFVMPAQ